MTDFNFIGFVNFDEVILEADINDFSLWEKGERFREEIKTVVENLIQEKGYE